MAFEAEVFLLSKAKAQELRAAVTEPASGPDVVSPVVELSPLSQSSPSPEPSPTPEAEMKTIRLVRTVPPEVWNRLGTKILPKLRSSSDLGVGIDLAVTVDPDAAESLKSDLQQILEDLGLKEKVLVSVSQRQ